MVQKSEELSPCLIAQHGAQQFSLRYASVVSLLPCLHESGAAPYSDAPTALCDSVSGEH